jgi:hypothetical protein
VLSAFLLGFLFYFFFYFFLWIDIGISFLEKRFFICAAYFCSTLYERASLADSPSLISLLVLLKKPLPLGGWLFIFVVVVVV